ncbi:activator-dependent family glycosyltransferase [Actinomadura sp. NAK00032]|uniref:activator-dependent family glycosyltransferase n=1 Tax=Actinomadura sp. NAK00032 TaxID=2742128 RepID=UPI00159049A8|nr:activator-dependent family glycosyltransferase [Actinomadura sp. NAK00032]QKW37578.1 activator-dependent family glycosyltransferase [Actinomadura sp. NAK00032]
MRVLFTTFASVSHLNGLVSMAWALRAAGHEVRVASQPDLADAITAAGLTAVPVGEPLHLEARMREIAAKLAAQGPRAGGPGGGPPDMSEVRPEKLTWESMVKVFGTMTPVVFANASPAATVDDLVGFCRGWRPDLVVWDTFTFAGSVAARACGAAHARMILGLDMLGNMRARFAEAGARRPAGERTDPLRDWLDGHLARHGASFAEDAVVGHWTIDPTPPSLRLPVPLHYVPVRHMPYTGRSSVPRWLHEPPPESGRVCVLGEPSLQRMWGPDATAEGLVSAVAGLGTEVVVVLDAEQQKGLGELPENVRVEDTAPLDALLPTCSAVVHAGGHDALGTAFLHGVPQLIVPEGQWDTVHKARLVQEYGAGLHLPPMERFDPRLLRERVARLLAEPSFAESARRLRGEVLGAPAPTRVVPLLEELTAEHRSPGA